MWQGSILAAGHIQVSQAPRRDEPDAPGEINYKYILHLFEELGYTDWIGLEYTPSGEELVPLLHFHDEQLLSM